MALIEGRIPQFAFKVRGFYLLHFDPNKNVIGVTIGLSMIAAVARIAIRFISQRRLHLDDYLLIFSCICLIVATVLLYLGLSAISFIEELNLNGIEVLTAGNISMEYFLDQLIFYQRINWAYLSLTWTTIFCVKFAFLAFFQTVGGPTTAHADVLEASDGVHRVDLCICGLRWLYCLPEARARGS